MPAHKSQVPPNYQSQPPAHRTEPRRTTSSSFTPAQRVSSVPPRRSVFTERIESENRGEEEEMVEIINQPPPPRFSQVPEAEGGPLTKTGYPDRRFKGQRDLPPPDSERKQRARTGGTIGDIPVTIEGKPDRRFKENRGLSEEELMAKWAEQVQQRFGRKR